MKTSITLFFMSQITGRYTSSPETRMQEDLNRLDGVSAVAAVTRPRELVHGERESFVGGYSWQRGALGVGTPGLHVGGGGT